MRLRCAFLQRVKSPVSVFMLPPRRVGSQHTCLWVNGGIPAKDLSGEMFRQAENTSCAIA